MKFPESFIDEVRATADIVRYVAEHVQLRKMGTSWKGLCPFHNEKTPSFNVSQDRGRFHCFGCGEGGDVFRFAMLHDKIGFPQAVEQVAHRFGITVPETHADQGPDRKEREELLAALEAATVHFERNLWTAPGAKAREYLLGRGFKKETLEKVRAGAAADSWGDLLAALRVKFPLPVLMTAGLVLESQDGKRPYDRFRGRAIFPIANDSGRIVAFGARSLDGSEPKYLNSPESPAYQKSKVLYHLHGAKDAIRRENRVVLMEGYLDVARAIEAGVTEAVASCGTALTAPHARLIRRFTDRVVMNFDQDEAGQKAARKSIDVLLEEGLTVQVVELPSGHDPDTYLKEKGAEAYRTRLSEAPGFMDWLIRRSAKENDTSTPAGKAAYLNALLPTVARFENAVERAAWVPIIAEQGGLDDAATRQELKRAVNHRATQVSEAPGPSPAAPERRVLTRLLDAEKLLVAFIAVGATGVAEALATLEERDLNRLRSAGILRTAREMFAAGEPVTVEALEARLPDDDDRRLLSAIAVQDAPEKGVAAAECVQALRTIPLEERMSEIQKDLPRASGPALEALLAEKLDIKRRMQGHEL